MKHFVLTWDVSVESVEDGGTVTEVQGFRSDFVVTQDVAVLFATALETDPAYSNVSLTCHEVTPREVAVSV